MALRDASNDIEMKQLLIRNTTKNLIELESGPKETNETENTTKIQTEVGSDSGSEDEAEVTSNSIWKKKGNYCKNFVRILVYEMLWSAWFLLVFLVFQRNCK